MRILMDAAVAVLFFAIAPGAHAETLVLRADRYLDVVTGRHVSPAVIVVEGTKIAAVNPATLPAGARTVDLSGHTLLPGLMDAHVHLNYELVEGWETEPARLTGATAAPASPDPAPPASTGTSSPRTTPA